MYDDLSDKINSFHAVTMNDIYSIGFIYMSVLSESPSALFGGIWQKIECRIILDSSLSYGIGSTIGQSGTRKSIPAYIAVNVWERTR